MPVLGRTLGFLPASCLLGGLLALVPACSTDEGSGGGGADGGAMNTGGSGSGSDFDQCIASITPLCDTRELDTEEEMNSTCMSTKFIPIPLTDGTNYGPVTMEAGPYGAQVMWNQGAGTEFVTEVNTQEDGCIGTETTPGLIDAFAEPPSVSGDLKNTRGLDNSLYTVFRPACMKEGETYPVITWANGTCGLTHGYALLLGGVASYGYVVVASNSTWTNTPPTNTVQLRALDYAEALNDDPESELYQKLDMDNIGAMGHSQGAGATAVAASDPRIDSIILWNTGASNEKPFLNVSGDRDVGGNTVGATEAATNGASKPGAWVFFHQVLETGGNFTGHLVLMEQPDRVVDLAVAWWDWQLKGDAEAKTQFVGSGCGLCDRDAEFEYGHNSLME